MAKEQQKSLRSQFKATSLKKLRKQVDEENASIGANSTEYLQLEDGKAIKIRIFPAHPGADNFYVPKKCYWVSVMGDDGEPHRRTVLDSRMHGGTKFDLIDEYVKWAKKACAGDAAKLNALTGERDSLNPSYSWLCYADKVSEGEQLRARIWEMRKSVRDALNRLAFNEDEEEAIEVDPYTDVDEGQPVCVEYHKSPNAKKGEKYYDVSWPKKSKPRPLTDEELEYFMTLPPLAEAVGVYGIRDFETALEGLQLFDEENEIGLFDDDEWLEHVEEIKAQYDGDEEEEEEKSSKKKPTAKKTTSKKVNKKHEEEEEEEEEEPEEDEEEEEEEEEEESEGDEFDDMDRKELKKYITDNGLDISVKKTMSDDDLREAIRAASAEEPEEEEEEEEEAEEKPKVTLADIRKRLNGGKGGKK